MPDLLLTSGSNQSTCGGPQERTCFTRRKYLRTHESSVDEQRQLSSQFVRALDAKSLGDPLEAPSEFLLMS
jgi:hypothetical protein